MEDEGGRIRRRRGGGSHPGAIWRLFRCLEKPESNLDAVFVATVFVFQLYLSIRHLANEPYATQFLTLVFLNCRIYRQSASYANGYTTMDGLIERVESRFVLYSRWITIVELQLPREV